MMPTEYNKIRARSVGQGRQPIRCRRCRCWWWSSTSSRSCSGCWAARSKKRWIRSAVRAARIGCILLMASQEIDSRAEKLMENMGYRMALQTKTASAAAAIGVPNAVNLKGSGQCYFQVRSEELTKFQGEFLWREYRKPGTEDFDDGTQTPGPSVSYFAPQLFTTEFTPLPLPDEEHDGAPAAEAAGESQAATEASARAGRREDRQRVDAPAGGPHHH